ncbi:MAG: hypothetical protein NWR72_12025 [Bacteroidia bacterium]|nr:hypothetical protein [Bacteroidia bacterium]
MIRTILTIGLMAIVSHTFSQDLKSLREIFLIMEKSKLAYELDFNEDKQYPTYERKRLYNNYYLEIDEQGNRLFRTYEPDSAAAIPLTQAETYFGAQKIAEARGKYQEAYALDSSNFSTLTYIAQTYGIEGNWEMAEKYYLKALEKNPVDYMNHWFIADTYRNTDRQNLCLYHLILAHLYNRNHEAILQELTETLALSKIKVPDWTFSPKIEMAQVGREQISVQSSQEWLSYAIVKAVWEYEPGYRESYGVEEGQFTVLEEFEALAALLDGVKANKKFGKTPMMKVLANSLDENNLVGFVIYEIFLPQYPNVAVQLSEGQMVKTASYFLQLRCSGKTMPFESLIP